MTVLREDQTAQMLGRPDPRKLSVGSGEGQNRDARCYELFFRLDLLAHGRLGTGCLELYLQGLCLLGPGRLGLCLL